MLALKPLHFSVLFTVLNHIMFSGMRFSVALDALHMQASALVVGVFSALFLVLSLALLLNLLTDLLAARFLRWQ